MHLSFYARQSIVAFSLVAFIVSALPASADLPSLHPNARPISPNPTGIKVSLTTVLRCPTNVAVTANMAGTKGVSFYYRFRNSAGTTGTYHQWFNSAPASSSAYDSWSNAPLNGWFVVEATPWPPVPASAGYAPFPPGQNTKWTVISNEAHFSMAPCLKPAPVNNTH